MQKFMSLVLSATMFAYMACAETPQKNTNNTLPEKVNSDTAVSQTEETEENLMIPENK